MENNCLTLHYSIANTFLKRFLGLMGKRSLDRKSALIIKPCNSIHMFFMRFPIDVVFVDKSHIICHTLHNIQPWKITKVYGKAKYGIELNAGILAENNIDMRYSEYQNNCYKYKIEYADDATLKIMIKI